MVPSICHIWYYVHHNLTDVYFEFFCQCPHIMTTCWPQEEGSKYLNLFQSLGRAIIKVCPVA